MNEAWPPRVASLCVLCLACEPRRRDGEKARDAREGPDSAGADAEGKLPRPDFAAGKSSETDRIVGNSEPGRTSPVDAEARERMERGSVVASSGGESGRSAGQCRSAAVRRSTTRIRPPQRGHSQPAWTRSSSGSMIRRKGLTRAIKRRHSGTSFAAFGVGQKAPVANAVEACWAAHATGSGAGTRPAGVSSAVVDCHERNHASGR